MLPYLYKKPAISWLFSLLLAITLTACSTTHINPPGPEVQTVLVLPVQTSNTSKLKYGFYYVYEIANLDDPSINAVVEFKLPIKIGFKLLDSLPPGDYELRQYSFHPIGRATWTYADNVFKRHERFRLEAGKLTIFQRSLNIRQVDDPTGKQDVNALTYREIGSVTSAQKNRILAALAKLPNFSDWEVSELNPNKISKLKNTPAPAVTIQQSQKSIAPSYHISGRYESDITSRSYYVFKKPYRNIQIQFEQIGNKIHGSDDSGRLKISGIIRGDTIEYFVIANIISGYYEISGEWKVSANGDRLEGGWKDGRGDDPGIWNLNKISN